MIILNEPDENLEIRKKEKKIQIVRERRVRAEKLLSNSRNINIMKATLHAKYVELELTEESNSCCML